MMNRFVFCVGVLACVLVICPSITRSDSKGKAESSGILDTVAYTSDYRRRPIGDPRRQRITFAGARARHEDPHNPDSPVTVTGESGWTAYPSSRRYTRHLAPQPSYPEYVRSAFKRIFSDRKPIGEETVRGQRCWKYAWHQPAFTSGCMMSPAQDISYWVRASAELPIIMRSRSSIGSVYEVTDLRLGAKTPESLFRPPWDLKPIRPFSLPAEPFILRTSSERGSSKYGWNTYEREMSAGNGESVTWTFRSENRHLNGTDVFEPPPKTMDFKAAQDETWRGTQVMLYINRTKVREETILGLKADVLQGPPWPDGSVPECWIVDHPIVGTICVRTVNERPAPDQRGRFEVVELRIPHP